MGPLVPSAPPALWVLGCLTLLIWLWVLCTACRKKQARRQPAGLQGTMMPVEMQGRHQTELHQGPLHHTGAGLTSSCARDGPKARPVVAENAYIHKLKETGRGPQGLDQGKVQGTPATQVNALNSRVNKPKRRDLRSALDQPDPKGRAAILTLGRNLDYEALPLRGLSTHSDLENVYESIQKLEA